MRKIFIILISFIFSLGCEKSSESKDYFYEILNGSYKDLLIEESFPLLLYESPINIQYFAYTDTLKVNGQSFEVPSEKVQTLIDTSFRWESKKADSFTIISQTKSREVSAKDYDTFQKNFGKGFVILSKPLINKNYALIREMKIHSFEEVNTSSTKRLLLFKKEKGEWFFVKQK